MTVGMQPPADALVLFGATGDLAKRKLFPALYHLERHGNLKIPVIGVARSDWTDQAFCQNAHDAIIAAVPDAEASVLDSLMARLDLIQGDYSDHKTWRHCVARLTSTRAKSPSSTWPSHPRCFPPSRNPWHQSVSTNAVESWSRNPSVATWPALES